MGIDYKIRDEKVQYNINRETAKISALSSGKIDKYDVLTGEEILSFAQRRVIERAKFTYSPLGKVLEKQRKTIENQVIKQVEALKASKSEENKEGIKPFEGIFPKDMRTNKSKNEIDEIKKWKEKIERKKLIYKTKKYTYDFQKYGTIRSFGNSIYTRKAIIVEAEKDQNNLLKNVAEFDKKS